VTWHTQRFILIGLIVLLGAAVWLMRSIPTEAPPRPEDFNPPVAKPDVPAPALPDSPETVDAMLTPRGAEPLATPPADLPIYPGATKLLLYRQPAGDSVQDFGVWSIDGAELDAVRQFYYQAATDAGFGLLADHRPRGELSRSDLRLNESAPSTVWRRNDQTLILRIRSVGPSIRVGLILRYTMQP
jgi:hypothetical protein